MLQLTAQRETIPVVAVHVAILLEMYRVAAVRVAVLQEVCPAVAVRVAVAVRPAHILPAHHRAVLRAAQAHSLREVAAVAAGRSVAVEAAVVRAAVVAAVQVVDADNSKLRTKT